MTKAHDKGLFRQNTVHTGRDAPLNTMPGGQVDDTCSTHTRAKHTCDASVSTHLTARTKLEDSSAIRMSRHRSSAIMLTASPMNLPARPLTR